MTLTLFLKSDFSPWLTNSGGNIRLCVDGLADVFPHVGDVCWSDTFVELDIRLKNPKRKSFKKLFFMFNKEDAYVCHAKGTRRDKYELTPGASFFIGRLLRQRKYGCLWVKATVI